MEQHDRKFHTVFFNKETGDFKIEAKVCEHDFQIVKKERSDGLPYLVNQCIKCATCKGSAVSQKGVDLDKIPVAIEENEGCIYTEYTEIWNACKEYKTKKEREDFEAYYSTPEWRNKRLMVLSRDNYLCQACLSEPAKEVHHLTYAHFKHEPLFDLVSVCVNCHDKITLMDKIRRGEICDTDL